MSKETHDATDVTTHGTVDLLLARTGNGARLLFRNMAMTPLLDVYATTRSGVAYTGLRVLKH